MRLYSKYNRPREILWYLGPQNPKKRGRKKAEPRELTGEWEPSIRFPISRGSIFPTSWFLDSQEAHFLFVTTNFHPDIAHFLHPYKWGTENLDINAKAVTGENVFLVTQTNSEHNFLKRNFDWHRLYRTVNHHDVNILQIN